ncbi:MAG: hypothetical protein KDA90_16675 [Planctomycetaceae bacterium]|nr:hypothetical protein [Planctomycetaceae bacterium]
MLQQFAAGFLHCGDESLDALQQIATYGQKRIDPFRRHAVLSGHNEGSCIAPLHCEHCSSPPEIV